MKRTSDGSDELWWCNSHGRPATHFDGREHCCDPRLGGILLPCRVVNLTGMVELKIIHIPCGKIAFWYEGPMVGTIKAGLATMPDGSKPEGNTPMRCGSCGQRISQPQYELRAATDED